MTHQSNTATEERIYRKGQALTEADRAVYYGYNLDLIDAMLHNCSTASRDNPQSPVEYAETEAIIHRSSTEHLTIDLLEGCDEIDLALIVYNPATADPLCEMTAIYLSRHEVHVLRQVLSRRDREEVR